MIRIIIILPVSMNLEDQELQEGLREEEEASTEEITEAASTEEEEVATTEVASLNKGSKIKGSNDFKP